LPLIEVVKYALHFYVQNLKHTAIFPLQYGLVPDYLMGFRNYNFGAIALPAFSSAIAELKKMAFALLILSIG